MSLIRKQAGTLKVPPEAILENIRPKYPHIAQNIEALWGSSDLHNYIASLTIMDRSYREGLAFDVLIQIETLDEIHCKMFNIQQDVIIVWDNVQSNRPR